MLRYLLSSLLLLISMSAMAQTVIYGHIRDADGVGAIGANVSVYQNEVFIAGQAADFDGNYKIEVSPGVYDIKIVFIGYPDNRITGVTVKAGRPTRADLQLKTEGAGIILDEVIVVAYKIPLIEQDNTTSGQVITSEQIRNLPTKSISALGSASAGITLSNQGSNVTVLGSRDQATDYYIDGIRVRGSASLVPQSEIDQMQVISGGLEAQYGDYGEQIIEEQSPKQETEFEHNISIQNFALPSPMPSEPNNESYAPIIENDYLSALSDPQSTFSIDVDRAAYSNVRRFLRRGQQPPPNAVRIEELINYFEYDYPEPEEGAPFAVTTEVAPCPWNTDHQLVHIGLQAKRIPKEALPANNLVFLLDVSGSMESPNKLPLLKEAFKLLVEELRPQDQVAIVVYAGASGLVLPSTSGSKKSSILKALEQLKAGGGTAGAQGIQLAYQTARQHFLPIGNNRVILATDGDFNVGLSSRKQLVKLIEKEREDGISLSVLGFGMGNYKDYEMEQLADNGNGNYAYIDQLGEAQKVLVQEFGGTLFTIAKDVKIQVEFNPAQVKEYRLIGYENRALNNEDFNDDLKDAGEIGVGHSVTALYEIIPAGSEESLAPPMDTLKYQQMELAESSELMTLKLRYKPLGKEKSVKISIPVAAAKGEATSESFRFAAAVAGWGLLLRNSKYKGQASYEGMEELARGAVGSDNYGHRKEFLELIELSKRFSHPLVAEY